MRAIFLLMLILFLLGGCAGGEFESSVQKMNSIDSPADAGVEYGKAADADAIPSGKLTSMQDAAEKPVVKRQIIHSAKVKVETAEIDEFSRNLNAKLEELGGFVAQQDAQRYSGERRVVNWTLRIDASQFDTLLDWIDTSVIVTNKEITSADITEEFVDLTARLENKKNTEQRLAKILEDRPGKLEDVLAVEREIDRVREEVERIEGRLRYLKERVSLSTITLTASTRVEFVQPTEATFSTRASEAWTTSLYNVRKFCEGLAIIAVAVAPWTPFILVIAIVGFMVTARLIRAAKAIVQ